MKPHPEFKYVSSTFEKLSEFKKKKKFKIKSSYTYFNNVELEIGFNDNKLHFSFDATIEDRFVAIYNNIDKLFNDEIVINEQASFSFLKYASDHLNIGLSSQTIEGQLNSMIQDNFEEYKNDYLRFLIPYKKHAEIGVIEYYKELRTDQDIFYAVGFNTLHISDLDIHFCRISDNNIQYLMIDVLNKENIQNIDRKIDAFLVALSYLYGTGFESTCYVFSSSDTLFKKINRVAFYTKPKDYSHAYPIYDSDEIKSYNFSKDYYILPHNVLINLCEKLLNEDKFLRAIEIYIEAVRNTYSLSKCILFSTCLETIVGLVKHETTINPIDSERFIGSDILTKLIQVVKDTEVLTQTDKEFIIEKKLPYLNSPTNPDKISLSISKFKIKLPNKFKNALKYRNLYLHGSIPKENILGSENSDNFVRAFELQFLVNILILKMVSYTGFLKNYSASMEYYTKKENNNTELTIDHSLYYKI